MTAAKIVTCKYPRCTKPVARTGKPGRPAELCGESGHTSTALWQLSKKETARAERTAGRQPAPITRPVSQKTETLSSLVRRFEELCGEELPALFADARDVMGVISDPGSLTAEIAHVRQEATQQVDAAELARADAERQAAQAIAERDVACAAQELADDAAAEAIEERDRAAGELDQVATATRKALEQMRAEVAAAQTAQAVAEEKSRAAERTASACTDEVRALRGMLDEQRRTHQLRMDEAHTAHAEGMAAANAAADQVIDNMRDRHAEELAECRAHGDQVRKELREDLRAKDEELNSLRRTGEFVPVPPAANGKRGFRNNGAP
jgi:colicin import membrane protein